MKKNQLPKQVLNTLLAYQIKSDDILDVCPFDLSFDSEYISGYLFLTSTKIGVAKSRHEQMTVRYFRGTKTADMQYEEDEKEYEKEKVLSARIFYSCNDCIIRRNHSWF